MDKFKTGAVLVWLFCALGIIAAGGMFLQLALHPLNDESRHRALFVFTLPYVLLTVSAWLWNGSRIALTLLACATTFAVFVGTVAYYQLTSLSLMILEARAQGTRVMSCGPPLAIFAVPMMYGISLFAILGGLGHWLGRTSPAGALLATEHEWRRKSLSVLGLSSWVQQWAAQNSITTIGELCDMTSEHIRSLGEGSETALREVQEKLTVLGLHLPSAGSSTSAVE